MRLTSRWRIVTTVFTVATVVYAIRSRQSHGTFVGVPFEFRVPTLGRFRQRWWNPEDARIFTPHVFGVGWSLNTYQALRRLGIIDRDDDAAGPSGEEEG
jgi:uncharacterized membrane protein